MKTWLLTISAAIFGGVVSASLVGQAQAERTPSAVAYINVGRLMAETSHGRGEAARLQTLQQQRSTDLRNRQAGLETLRQQIASTTDSAARAPLAQKEAQQRTEFERAVQQAALDLQSLQREVNTDMQRRTRTILDELMKTQPYQLVLNADAALLWSTPELDLTNSVISRMNGQ